MRRTTIENDWASVAYYFECAKRLAFARIKLAVRLALPRVH